MRPPANILISRTDSLGDVVLTLPVATVLKQHFPDMVIGFIGTSYTRPIIEACANVDVFIDKDAFLTQPVTLAGKSPQAILHVFPKTEIAKRAKALKIPYRIGTTNRVYHWLTCNKLVKLSRKSSDLHEAQLNLKLLQPLGITRDFTLQEIAASFALQKLPDLPDKFAALLHTDKFKLIIHAKSRGNGKEWDLKHYISLIETLDTDKFQIFISGTATENASLQLLIDKVGDRVTDIIGLMTLTEFIAFIAACDGLLASGTGPLHIAAALQKHALGIFPPMRPIHPGRWQPLGRHAKYFVINKTCSDCKVNQSACPCVQAILPIEIKEYLESLLKA